MTTLLSVAKNRIQEHLEANERRKISGERQGAVGGMTFGNALTTFYREHLQFEGSGLRLVSSVRLGSSLCCVQLPR